MCGLDAWFSVLWSEILHKIMMVIFNVVARWAMEFAKNIYLISPSHAVFSRLISTLRKSQLELEKMGKVFISGISGLAAKKLLRHIFFFHIC